MNQIIIIGAGAAGLMAGCELAGRGKQVIILEARDRIGGRMNTIRDGFNFPVDEGAEFIHGDLPFTLSILKESGINFYPMGGRWMRFSDGKISGDNVFGGDYAVFNSKLRSLEKDITVKKFLDDNFDHKKNAGLINSVKGFVEGYDSADYERASSFALRDEWLRDDDSDQYRIEGGYAALYNHLKDKFNTAGGKILLSHPVKKINWSFNHSEITCSNNETFNCEKVIVTIPTGVLKDKSGEGFIEFNPPVPELENWIEKSGYGSIVKILIEFKSAFWDDEVFANQNTNQAKELGFLFSDQKIPTWWTQQPSDYPLLTGWLAGPKAKELENSSDDEIFNHALQSLSVIFNISIEKLIENIHSKHIKNWTADPFTKGAYAYNTPETADAIKLINRPFGNTLYFAGEALYEGKEMGTVEAALASGYKICLSMDVS